MGPRVSLRFACTSGRYLPGGRPRKLTQAEARAEALSALVPAAIKSLAAHLGDGEAGAWRAALRVFELSYGKPAETPEDLPEDIDPFDVAGMTPMERARLVSQVVAKYPHLAPLAPVHLLPDVGDDGEGHHPLDDDRAARDS